MRLINTNTLQLEIHYGASIPSYAILSHRWSRSEIFFGDYNHAAVGKDPRFLKVRNLCNQARADGLAYAWIDTCCIDKTNSVELSEAINSMFRWYMESANCYVFLADYHDHASLRNCQWFTRGWTLQELVAPQKVHFYDGDMAFLGSRDDLQDDLYGITGIAPKYMGYLEDESGERDSGKGDFVHRDSGKRAKLLAASVAQRMSWASARATEKDEDKAYCLLGIFAVNMPMLYGEGGQNAFLRLQHAIIAQSDDESLFAWTSATTEIRGMLARSPREFENAKNVVPHHFALRRPPITFTSQGLEVHRLPRSLLSRIVVPGANRIADDDPLLTLQCIEQLPGLPSKRIAVRLTTTEEGTWVRIATATPISHYMENVLLDAIYPGGWFKTYIEANHAQNCVKAPTSHTSTRSFAAQAFDAGALVLWSSAVFSWSCHNQLPPAGVRDVMESCLLLMVGWKWTGLSYLFLATTFIATTAPKYVMRSIPSSWLRPRTILGTTILNVLNVSSRWTVMLGVGLATIYEMRTRRLFAR